MEKTSSPQNLPIEILKYRYEENSEGLRILKYILEMELISQVGNLNVNIVELFPSLNTE